MKLCYAYFLSYLFDGFDDEIIIGFIINNGKGWDNIINEWMNKMISI